MGENPVTNSALNAGLSRRRFLGALGIGGTAVVLAACSSGGDAAPATSAPADPSAAPSGSTAPSASAEPSAAPSVDFTAPEGKTQEDQSDVDKTVYWASWPSYIDVTEKSTNKKIDSPTIKAWEEESGLKVMYGVEVEDNQAFFDKYEKQLSAGEDIGWDIVVLTDWMASVFIQNGWALKFDRANMPNFPANLIPQLQGAGFDPNREYTAPWFSGFSGIVFNKKAIKDLTGKDTLTTVDELWDPALKGKVTVITEMRDTMACILPAIGYYPDDFTDAEFTEGVAYLQKQLDSGQMAPLAGSIEVIDKLGAGDLVAAVSWNVVAAILGDEFDFSIPEVGGGLWTDNMLIPAMAKHKKNAELTINHYYDPMVAAEVAAAVGLISPVVGAQQAMQTVNPELVNNGYIFPTQSDLNRAYVFMALDKEQSARYGKEFATLYKK